MNELFESEPKVLADEAGNVWKYIFHFKGAIAEAVLYRYVSFDERTVICISVQSGCAVGCKFCGTGAKFIRDLSSDEIKTQVSYVLKDQKIDPATVKKFQIMFMSMGEPFLNYDQVSRAIRHLNMMYPNAQLLVSTIGPNECFEDEDRFTKLSQAIDKIGLQFSIHKSTDAERDKLIPYKDKLKLKSLATYGKWWNFMTGRKVYLNYCVDGTNCRDMDFRNLCMLFDPETFCFTFSVICSNNENMKTAGYRNIDKIREFESKFLEAGYDTRIFDPAGQDTIGGGCGQLFYVQEYLKKGKGE